MDKKRISVVVPIYQNEENIESSVACLMSVLGAIEGYEFELVLVDDGSSDSSYRLLCEQYKKYPEHISLVKLTKNFGQTQAIREGVRQSTGDCIVVISADLQDPPELIVDMLAEWERGNKLVIGERQDRVETGVGRFFSGLYWRFVNRYAVKGFPEGGFDFCLFDRDVKRTLDGIGERNTSIFPLIYWLGYSCSVLQYSRRARKGGVSQWTLAKKVQLTIDTVFNFTYLPVRFISVSGVTISIASMLYACFLLVKWGVYGSSVEGWTSLTVLVLALGGLTLFSLGIVAEYLWRILDETRNRPASIVDEVKECSLSVDVNK